MEGTAHANRVQGWRSERGAIMVMGVFLSCSLIAGMWYMMGIGDAILWRDRSQEAADSIAFTSAAIHARGMNFISAINIMMLIIVSIYLIMCIVRSILDMVLYITGDPTDVLCVPFTGCKDTKGHTALNMVGQLIQFLGGGFDPPHGFLFDDPLRYTADNAASRDLALNSGCTIAVYLCCLADHPLETIADVAGPAYAFVEKLIVKYEQYVMKPLLPIMHAAEVYTAKLSPWIGAGASVYAGAQLYERTGADPNTKYRHWGLAISPSMFTSLKKPQQIKRLKQDLEYIDYQGNGCGPTMCADGKVSHSGWYVKGTKAPNAQCCDQAMIDAGQCTQSGICSGHGGIGNQDNLYETVTVDQNKDYRLGLPVQAENMNELCQKAMSYLGDFIAGTIFAKMPFGGQHGIGGLVTKLFNALGNFMKKAYCTYDPAFGAGHSCSGYTDVFPKGSGPDDANEFWAIHEDDECPFDSKHPPFTHKGGNGPMKVVDYAPNGGDYMQVYGVIANNHYNVTEGEYGLQYGNWSKLRLAVGPKEAGKSAYDDQANGPLFYIAEAEFYHDCDSAWGDSACNGDDHATYRLNWRTRLRRVHKPVYITDLTGKIPGSVTKILNYITKNSAFITYWTLETTNVDIGAVMSAVEALANLAGPDALMPTIYH